MFKNEFIRSDLNMNEIIPHWQPVFPNATPPIFQQDWAGRSLFYAPGWLVRVPENSTAAFLESLHSASPEGLQLADELLRRAEQGQRAWADLHNRPFHPVCLTLYLNNTCNLNCGYCFSEPGLRAPVRLSLEAVQAAAEIVTGYCQASRKPFTVVFHGGGEPTLEHVLIFQTLDWLEQRTDRDGLALFRYLATNGVMPAALAERLARRFDLVGLSCDGPQDIQDSQRPFRKPGRRGSSRYVEQTARAVHAAGKALHVRVTVTPETLSRQAEIAEYICRQLRPQEIHVEPVYVSGQTGRAMSFETGQAEAYVEAFFQARSVAGEYGVKWLASGSRPAEVHGAYCHVWRDVLNLTPEGAATACFALVQAEDARERGVDLGGWEGASGRFTLDQGRVEAVRRALGREPQEECLTCFNRYSCVRQCPETCLLDAQARTCGFRCRVQALMTDRLIQRTAERLGSEMTNPDEILGGPVGWDG